MWYHLILSFSFFVFNVSAQTLGGFCRTPLNEGAKCISVYKCSTLLPLIGAPSRTPEQTKFLHSSSCGFDSSGTPYVCCGKNLIGTTRGPADEDETSYTPNPLIPPNSECGFQLFNKIFNGEVTAFDEFPWMAVLQYVKPSGQRRIACAGSLINSKYVLTAAHCVTGEVLTKAGRLVNVRLGEYDTNSPGRDCITIQDIHSCNQEEVNVAVAEAIPHPRYTGEGSKLYDIALVRLASEVRYSDFISPVCLPLPTDASLPQEKLVVAGWGKTERGRNSNVKLKLQVPITTKSRCASAFQRLNVEIDDSHICAGGEAGKDSCTGDSGGPLMRTLQTWTETEGKRGGNEVATILRRYIKMVDDRGVIKHILLYSDSCSGQNKNKIVLSCIHHCLQVSENLISIQMNYLLPGHTYMPVDSMHSVIEKSVSNNIIWAPSQWATVFSVARKNPKPYHVEVLNHIDFEGWDAIADKYFKGNLVGKISKVRIVTFKKSTPFRIYAKYSMNTEAETDEIEVCKTKEVDPQKIYKTALPVSKLKYRDLVKLCTNNTVPPIYHHEYINLTTASTIKDTLNETDVEDED